ncbi:MAG: hypothetical protein SF182_01540 [Deltaproteobacteria bacterium]|nr:hypothetical protein [Deltaproteobacteria bacterium]
MLLAAPDVPAPPMWTSPSEYDARSCNRCGDCCEAFWLPSIFQLTDALVWAFHDCTRGCIQSALRGLAPYYELAQRRCALTPCAERDRDWHTTLRLQAEWLLDLEPIPEPHLNHERYRCTRFERAPDGSGGCTRYEDRPQACRMFPYTRIVDGVRRGPSAATYPRCAWYVNIIDVHRAPPAADIKPGQAPAPTEDQCQTLAP